jgi:hypothetical protein
MAIGSLVGRRCVITGASRGIGAAIAHRFAAEGAKCILIGRNQRTLELLSASLLRDKFMEPNPHRVIAGDVADRAFWAALAGEEKEVDVLVNAAGITHYSLLMATQPKMVEDVIGTNLMGAIWGCQVMVKNMMRRKQGILVNNGVYSYLDIDIFPRLYHQRLFITRCKRGEGKHCLCGIEGWNYRFGSSSSMASPLLTLSRLNTISSSRSGADEHSSQCHRARLY